MTHALKTMAELALSGARRELEQTGSIHPYFLLRYPQDEEMLRVPVPPEAMNSGKAKELIFDFVRAVVKRTGIRAVIFVSDGWGGKATAKGNTPEGIERIGRLSFQESVDQGLVERNEAVLLTAQTPTEVFTVIQFYDRDEARRQITFGKRETLAGAQGSFDGRTKMFDDPPQERVI